MASYKVAQDVEAEDKLLGPFSFRQFMYLVIAAMAGVLAWGLSRLFIGLAIIPLPIVLFFVVLALPLRKDQPMEVYLAAIVSFYLKPRKRLWQPDGVQSLIEIRADSTDPQQLTKNISGSEAERRLAYLASIADSQGWAIRNAPIPQTNTSMIDDAYHDAQNVPDSFDENSGLARTIDSMIDKADAARRESMLAALRTPQPQAPPAIPQAPAQQGTTHPDPAPPIAFNPYPTAMRQHIIAPASSTPPAPTAQTTPQPATAAPAQPQQLPQTPEPQTTSDNPPSPDIISLANNKDLTVETIAREAHRLEAKHRQSDDEVVISLR